MVSRSLSPQERRHRLALRHRLAPSARVDDDLPAITRSVLVLHASDPATVVLSALARMRSPDPAAVEHALYDDRTLVRMLAMRRTLFSVCTEDAPVVQAAASAAVAASERRKLVALLGDKGVSEDPARWLRAREKQALALLEELGQASTAELSSRAPQLARQIPMNEGKRYAGNVGVGSRVLLLLAADGRVVRGRPQGPWTSSLHRWATVEWWLGQPLAVVPADEARVELAGRWLERFGPATVADLKWWTGWTLGQTRAALASVAVETVDLDGVEGLVLAGDADPTPPPEPWVALLPSLDPTVMGWQQRHWYLGEHKPQVFDGFGNAGATVWADGRIVGGWAQRKDGEVVFRLLEDLGQEQEAAIEQEAARLQDRLGKIRVVPRFPAPLDQALSA